MPSCWNKGIDFSAQVSLMLCLLKSFQVVSTAVTVTGVALQTRGGQSSSVQSPFGPGDSWRCRAAKACRVRPSDLPYHWRRTTPVRTGESAKPEKPVAFCSSTGHKYTLIERWLMPTIWPWFQWQPSKWPAMPEASKAWGPKWSESSYRTGSQWRWLYIWFSDHIFKTRGSTREPHRAGQTMICVSSFEMNKRDD